MNLNGSKICPKTTKQQGVSQVEFIEPVLGTKNIRLAMRDLIAQHDWDYFVTANLNRDTNWHGAKRLLRDWHAQVDRRILGGRWQRKKDQRTFFIACCEGGETNIHWHLFVKVKQEKKPRFEQAAAVLWEGLVPSGSMDIQKLPSKADTFRAAGYATKDFWRKEAIENFVLSTEFIGD